MRGARPCLPRIGQPKKKHNLIRPVEQDGIGCAKEGN
jgi:hypothetical protein